MVTTESETDDARRGRPKAEPARAKAPAPAGAEPKPAQKSADAPGAGAASSSAAPAVKAAPSHRLRWILLALVLIAGGIGLYWYRRESALRESTELVLEGNIDVRQVNLAFKVEGRVATLAVDEGDAVKAGQVVATLDKRYFEDDLQLVRARRDNARAALARLENGSRPEEIAEAQAQVNQQIATLERANSDFDRAKQLVGKGAVSREVYDQARSAFEEAEAKLKFAQQGLKLAQIGPRQEDIDAARAQLAAEEASLVQSERRLTDSELIAPSDGIILTRAREKGAIVAAGETVFALTLATPVWVRTYVGERDLGRIQPGMVGAVHTDSAPDKPYVARVGFISPKAEFTPKNVETRELRTDLVYRLRVVVDNPDGGLRQGMPVTVTFDLHQGS